MKKKATAYLRVSTDDQGRSGNGIEAQRAAIIKFAADNGYELVEIVEEWASGKLGLESRPVLASLVQKSLKTGTTIMVSKLDRLSREVAFISNLMNTRAKFVVVALGEDVDPMMMHIYAAFAEQERKVIGQRTKDALAALKAKGVKLGNANHKSPETMEIARANSHVTSKAKADAFALKMRPIIERILASGKGYTAAAKELNDHGWKTARGGSWGAQTVINMQQRWAA